MARRLAGAAAALLAVVAVAAERLADSSAAVTGPRGHHGAAAAALWMLAASPHAAAAQGSLATQARRADLRAMDADGDGLVDREEFLSGALDEYVTEADTYREARRRADSIFGCIFDASDLNGDALLDDVEMDFAQFHVRVAIRNGAFAVGSRLQSLSPDDSEYTCGEGEAATTLRRFDVNTDGAVDLEEFVSGMRGVHYKMKEGLGDMFDKADVGRRGLLGPRQLQFALFMVRDHSLHEVATAMVQHLDHDGDGRITRAEFEQASVPGAPSILAHLRGLFDTADEEPGGALDASHLHAVLFGMIDNNITIARV